MKSFSAILSGEQRWIATEQRWWRAVVMESSGGGEQRWWRAAAMKSGGGELRRWRATIGRSITLRWREMRRRNECLPHILALDAKLGPENFCFFTNGQKPSVNLSVMSSSEIMSGKILALFTDDQKPSTNPSVMCMSLTDDLIEVNYRSKNRDLGTVGEILEFLEPSEHYPGK
ncbi:hypothetical protein LR48_Vigan03g140900 [Vigna angularis]|uniref:Uncharacterized protein n=1 Tax=Phaseolus angularis TaxID=3914 RepID=A0A0L9U5V0_PHAAN|nr:hypothetical protein LR48_Vigan03g140900 [Vigna angularis]